MRLSKNVSLLIGVFLVSLSNLMLELMLTRICSVVMYYHFAFLAVSLALLGISVSGICVYLFAKRFPPERATLQASLFSLLFALSTLLALTTTLFIPFKVEASLKSVATPMGLRLILVVLAMALPFAFAGFCLSIVLKHFAGQVSRIYFMDLMGAGLGCILLIPALDLLGGITTVILIAILACLAAMVFAWAAGHRRQVYLAATVGLVLVAFAALNANAHILRIRFAKGLAENEPVYEKWNSFSRVAVFPVNVSQKKTNDPHEPTSPPSLDRMVIDIDAGASTVMTRFDGDFSPLEPLKLEIASAPYHLTPKRKVLIIGSGGGNDVLIALLFGSQSITAVEMNPIMFEIVNERFADFSGHLYSRPEVIPVVDEARSFIQHTGEKYDIIQGTLVDTWAASSAGAYALSENYLYTKEAFHSYWDHLTDEGLFAMTRWHHEPPLEMLRLVSLALEVMEERQVPEPGAHIVVLRREFLSTFLWKKSPFTSEELRTLEEAGKVYWFLPIYTPANQPDPLFAELITGKNRQDFYRSLGSDVTAPEDNKPFFFYFTKAEAPNPLAILRAMLGGTEEPSTLLAFLFLLLSSLAFVFILLPLLLFGWGRREASWTSYLTSLLYFSCLGLGFILVEIVLIQRFILFLGHPVYATAVILFSLLFFGGLGSYLSGRFSRAGLSSGHRVILLSLVLLLFVYVLALPWFVSSFIGLSIVPRIALTVIALCPLGLLMGMPFPLGIKITNAKAPSLIPWAWGVNGAFSVLGSVLAAILSINYGFNVTLASGLTAYLIALLTVAASPTPKPGPQPAPAEF